MTAATSTDHEEAPLLSNRFLFRLTAVIAVLAASTVAISLTGRWYGQQMMLAGHTDSTTLRTVTIGMDTLMLADNTIRFERQRMSGTAERIDLYLTLPDMKGYSSAESARFSDASQSNGLLFLQISQSTMSRDMSGRLEPIYSHLFEGSPHDGGHGLTIHDLREDAGYGGERLLTAPVGGGPDYAVRCMLPADPAMASAADCQRDIHVGQDLSVLYRFSSTQLADWQAIDSRVRDYVRDRLLKPSVRTSRINR